MKNFKNSRFSSKRNRFKIETTQGRYRVRDTKYDHIVHVSKFKHDVEKFCKFQNKHCTWGNFEFPKFMRPQEE